MASQAAYFVHGHTGAHLDEETPDEAVYTFTGALVGAGAEFDFGLFALTQGADIAGDAARAIAKRLLHDVYLPMLPWEATERPNALDSISTVIEFDKEQLAATTIALIVNNRVYMGWQGDGRIYLLTNAGIEGFADDAVETVGTCALAEGASLLLCSVDLTQILSAETIHQVVKEAPNAQDACDQLADAATEQDNVSRPLILLVQRPPSQ